VSTLGAKWNRFWFEPTRPLALDICRIVFFGTVFLYFLGRDFSAWADVFPAFWKPIWLFHRLPLPVFSKGTLKTLELLWRLALLLSAVGFLTRVSSVIAFVLGAYLLLMPANFGYHYREELITIITSGILAASRCGASLSVDSWIKRAREGRSSTVVAPSGEYTWPIRAVCLALSFVFFGAGVAKLRHSGLEWITSDTLAIFLVQSNYMSAGHRLTSWGLNVAQHKWLCHLLAAVTIGWEVCFPLTLFSRTARWVLLPISLSMLAGIRLLMGAPFELLALCYVFWMPWESLVSWSRR